jgi:hypothetical protein
LHRLAQTGRIEDMEAMSWWKWVCVGLLAVAAGGAAAEPSATAARQYDAYVAGVEQRIGREHRTAAGYGVDAGTEARLRRGEVAVEKMGPDATLPGAMLHHWRARAFVAGARAADVERVLRDVAAYPRVYAPEVERARATAEPGDRMRIAMRVRQKHVLTVVLDTDYDVEFGRLDAGHGWSWSRSTRVAEIAGPGTAHERVLGPQEDHGFLWRQNTYWTWAEADGGLYLQLESVSLSRAIPTGLGWAVGPFVESVPRESLEFTLRATVAAMRHSDQ